MLRHNLLLIYRNFKRFKATFFINLFGLSTGLTCVLLIYLWVKDERGVDRFFDHGDRIYHVMQNMRGGDDKIGTGAGTPGPLAKALAEEIPEVEYAAAYVPYNIYGANTIITIDDKRFKVRTEFASADFFNVFSYKITGGDKVKPLDDRRSVVITEEMATKMFGTTDNVVGKTIGWTQGEASELFRIQAICQTPPVNATNQFDIILNYDFFLDKHDWLKTWTSSDPYAFVMLKEGTSPEAFEKKIVDFIKKWDKDSRSTLVIQRAADHYLYGRFENGKATGGRIEYIRLFGIIASFILVIASINYMNLSTARASRRIKEVGIKKAIGANRKSLAFQYLGESIVITVLAMGIAILLTDILLNPFNTITGKHLVLRLDAALMSVIILITVITGMLAGSYPALYLSGFNTATILKGKLNVAVGELWARKGLVIFQFAISVILIVAVLIVYKQIDYIQSKNLGYNRANVVHFETEKVSETFLSEIKSIPGVLNAARFYHDLTGSHGSTGDVRWEGKGLDDYVDFSNFEVGYDLIETMGFQVVQGKSMSRDFGSIDQIVFNEAAIKAMGLKDPVGQTITVWGIKRKVVGVVKDFNYESMYEKVKPAMFFLVPMIEGGPSRIMVKLQAGNERETLDRLKTFYVKNNPGFAFDFTFMDDDYQRLYASELRVSTLSQYFAGIAIVISCLGLFALASFTAERRLKEIGIRKVLGSSNASIVYLLSSEFTKIVAVAIAIALPVSYFMMKQWLGSFAYPIPLELWYFIVAGSVAILISWLTVGIQALKASYVNPVQCLKEE
ncbi:MAG: ABC transporter permease [Chryseolinea sp.]